MNRKDRRHSGRNITKIYHPDEFPYEEVLWNDWDDYRDGMREFGWDKSKKISKSQLRLEDEYYAREDKQNYAKLKKQQFIRKLRKNSPRNQGILM